MASARDAGYTAGMSASATPMRILACQIDIPPTPSAADRDAHLARVVALIDGALDRQPQGRLPQDRLPQDRPPIDLVVLPELASIDYCAQSFERLDELAEPLRGPSFEAFSTLARRRRVAVAFSFARRAERGYRICLAICDRDGELLGHYDKIYLAQFGASAEKNFFQPGDGLFTATIGGFVVAPIICADIRTPELCRTLVVDHGAQIILHCGAYYRDPSFHSWHHFAIARALENQVYFVSLNRAGCHYGHSLFVPPWVDDTKPPSEFAEHDEQLREFELTHGEIDSAREQYPFLRDRRSDHVML